MQGRAPKSIAIAFSNCADPSKEAEMNGWYSGVHIPDFIGPGIFVHATRYVNPRATGGAADPKYMAIYETDRDDPAAAWAEALCHRAKWSRWSTEFSIHPALSVTLKAMFKATGNMPPPLSGKKTLGVLVGMVDCSDAAREAEFNRWYDEVHALDVLKTGLYWSALRYVNAAPGPGQPKYLALYETEGDGPATQVKSASRPNKDTSRDLGLNIRRYVGSFNLFFTHAEARPGARAARS